jgi:hypothetical protein
MRICFSTKQAEGAADGQQPGVQGGAEEVTRGILSNLLKRNLCENIMPVLIQLKDLMERRFSPFLRQLRYCIREILRDFKDDLKDILAGDAQLASEIAHDLENEGKVAKDSQVVPKGPYAPTHGRQSLGRMMHVDCTPNGRSHGDCTPIMDSEAKTNNRGSMSLPKGRKSNPAEGLSPNFGGEGECVSLPVNEVTNSPDRTPGPGTGRKSLGAGGSPVPSEADRRRQDAIARALGVSPTKSPVPAATPKDAQSKDFDFTADAETEEPQNNKTPKRPMAEIQAQIDAENVADTAKADKTPKAGSKENKTKRTAGKENGTTTRKAKRNKSNTQLDTAMTA